MRKLVSAFSLTLLMTINAFASTEAAAPAADTSTLVAIIIVVAAIAIPNLLKSTPG